MDDAAAMKRCSRCKQLKPLDAFNRLSRAKDGLQWNCRDCNAAWHAENKAHHNALIHARTARVRQENQDRLFTYLEEHPCLDCGEDDIVVLEFDHLRDKVRAVAEMVNTHGWAAIAAEIEKCEVVCANCHRRRTARRAETARWRRVRSAVVDDLPFTEAEIESLIRNRLASL
jgi:hypothetical protein